MENDVDAAIVLAVDTSSSIGVDEATRQRQGHVEALRSRELGSAITSGVVGCVAIAYVEWSSAGRLRIVLAWTRVCNHDEAAAAAAIIEQFGDRAVGRKIGGRTSLSYALDAASRILDEFPGRAARKIIDISANGTNNDGLPVAGSRMRALAKGHIVNGIVMSRTEPGVESDLPAYFLRKVICGPGSFVIVPEKQSDYAMAIRRKLVLEISGLTRDDPGAAAARLELMAANWSGTSRPERLYPRNSRRRILPTGVFGSSVRNSMNFGRL